jgi:hypothetical protein
VKDTGMTQIPTPQLLKKYTLPLCKSKLYTNLAIIDLTLVINEQRLNQEYGGKAHDE